MHSHYENQTLIKKINFFSLLHPQPYCEVGQDNRNSATNYGTRDVRADAAMVSKTADPMLRGAEGRRDLQKVQQRHGKGNLKDIFVNCCAQS